MLPSLDLKNGFCPTCGGYLGDTLPRTPHLPEQCIEHLKNQIDIAHRDWENLSNEVREEREYLQQVERRLLRDNRSLIARIAGSVAGEWAAFYGEPLADGDKDDVARSSVDLALRILAEVDRRAGEGK
jgi:hypothetical protein